jgi:hypothetical protein
VAITAEINAQKTAKWQTMLGDVVRGRAGDAGADADAAAALAEGAHLGPRLDWVDPPAA